MVAGEKVGDWRLLLTVFAVGALVVVTRRPDAFTNPQFYVEDGIWYANAHEWGGLNALVTPYRGYFVTIQRLGGWLAQFVPLSDAPLFLNSIAVVIQTLPAVLICSARFAHVVPDRWTRVLLALFYVAMPNSWGTISNITHAMWHLAALACFVLLAKPADRVPGRIFDIAVLLLAGLSGPFAIFLTPIAALCWRRDRSGWRLALTLILAAAAIIQMVTLVVGGSGPNVDRPALGASVTSFFSVWTTQVVYGAFVGQRGLDRLFLTGESAWQHSAVLIVSGSAALGVIACAARRGPFELRMLVTDVRLHPGSRAGVAAAVADPDRVLGGDLASGRRDAVLHASDLRPGCFVRLAAQGKARGTAGCRGRGATRDRSRCRARLAAAPAARFQFCPLRREVRARQTAREDPDPSPSELGNHADEEGIAGRRRELLPVAGHGSLSGDAERRRR